MKIIGKIEKEDIIDISFGSFFLKAPFCPQKGAFKFTLCN
jgi:hypothetical protein